MSILVLEGSNGSGKSTLIKHISKEYNIIPRTSIPDWYRKYIEFARTCNAELQKKIYIIGHEANIYECNNGNYIFDRFFYTTIIRLNYQLKKTIQETADEILSINIFHPHTIYLKVSKYKIKERLQKRNNFIFDEDFYNYENNVYLQLYKKYDKIYIVDNNNSIDNTMLQINNIIKSKKLLLRKE